MHKSTTPTPAFYEALLASFREKPGNFSAAGRLAGCHRRTAQQWYEKGHPPNFLPIKQVLADEELEKVNQQRELRMIEANEEAAERSKKRKAEEERDQQELSIMKLARSNVLGAAMALAHPNASIRRLAEAVALAIDSLTTDLKADPKSVKPERILNMVNAYARAIRVITEASRVTVIAERVRRGEDVGLPPEETRRTMTPEQAIEMIEMAHEAAERAKRNGLVALPGGKSKGP